MNRKPTKNTRGPNIDEKRFMAWVKWQNCCCCGVAGPSIVDHAFGATFKHNKVLIGHWFILPLCPLCDSVDTHGSRRAFRDKFGPKSELWLKLIEKTSVDVPIDVVNAIKDWGK